MLEDKNTITECYLLESCVSEKSGLFLNQRQSNFHLQYLV